MLGARRRPCQKSSAAPYDESHVDARARAARTRASSSRSAGATPTTSSPRRCTTLRRRTWATCLTRSSTAAPSGPAAFREAEERLELAIRERFAIKAHVAEIKRADRALPATERRALSAERWR
jgi:hypothetical protein